MLQCDSLISICLKLLITFILVYQEKITLGEEKLIRWIDLQTAYLQGYHLSKVAMQYAVK